MSSTLYPLRHTVKEILAAAVLDVFPGTQLLGGHVSEKGFEYRFLFSEGVIQRFGERELARIEDQMRLIAYENRPITKLEMMRENAQHFFEHLGQLERADQIGETPDNIVEIFKMEAFHDFCEGPFLTEATAASSFKLLHSEFIKNELCIEGTAFHDKESLKDYLKRYKDAKKRDAHLLAPRLGLLDRFEEEWVFLPKGEALRKSLIDQWRDMHAKMGFQFVHASLTFNDPLEFHEWVFKREKPSLPYRLAQICEEAYDVETIFCKEKDLIGEITSSLQFIEQTIKIFGFERRVYLRSSKKDNKKNFAALLEALKQSEIPFLAENHPAEEEPSESLIDFRLVNVYGVGLKGPYIAVDADKHRIVRSLFGSMEQWILLLIEQSNRAG